MKMSKLIERPTITRRRPVVCQNSIQPLIDRRVALSGSESAVELRPRRLRLEKPRDGTPSQPPIAVGGARSLPEAMPANGTAPPPTPREHRALRQSIRRRPLEKDRRVPESSQDDHRCSAELAFPPAFAARRRRPERSVRARRTRSR